MVLESTIICVDNSDFMRNGDFIPTRLQAQHDAVNMVCGAKTRANPENNVGLLTMAGKRVEVLSTLTSDTGRIMAKLHLVQPSGFISFSAAIRVAHLALKHRQGKNHKTRIVAFVGSPIDESEKDLEKLAKKLKKEKVFVDLVNFGEHTTNSDKLTGFVNTLNGKDGQQNHLVTVPPGPILSDALVSSPIMQGEEGGGGGAGGGNDFEFGVDAEADPELALALRVSMEEQRQQEEAKRAQEAAAARREATIQEGDEEVDDDEAQLAAALAMSRDAGSLPGSRPVPNQNIVDFSTMTEDEQIAFAMQMSLQPEEPAPPGAPKKLRKEDESKNESKNEDRKRPRESLDSLEDDANPATPQRKGNEEKKPRVVPDEEEEDYSEVMTDPEFLQSVLQSLPGVDPDSAAIRDAVNSISGEEKKKKKDTDKKPDKK